MAPLHVSGMYDELLKWNENSDVYEPSIGFVRTENSDDLSVGAEAIFDR